MFSWEVKIQLYHLYAWDYKEIIIQAAVFLTMQDPWFQTEVEMVTHIEQPPAWDRSIKRGD